MEVTAIPTLEKLTEHEDPQIAARAKAALRQVRGREGVAPNYGHYGRGIRG